MAKASSNEEKKLKGTDQNTRVFDITHNDGNVEIIPFGEELDEWEKEIFDDVCRHLNEFGVLRQSDSLIITQYSITAVQLYQIQQKIQSVADLTQTYDSGATAVSGLFTAQKQLQDRVDRYSAQLGLSPKDREKLPKTFTKKKKTKTAQEQWRTRRKQG